MEGRGEKKTCPIHFYSFSSLYWHRSIFNLQLVCHPSVFYPINMQLVAHPNHLPMNLWIFFKKLNIEPRWKVWHTKMIVWAEWAISTRRVRTVFVSTSYAILCGHTINCCTENFQTILILERNLRFLFFLVRLHLSYFSQSLRTYFQSIHPNIYRHVSVSLKYCERKNYRFDYSVENLWWYHFKNSNHIKKCNR